MCANILGLKISLLKQTRCFDVVDLSCNFFSLFRCRRPLGAKKITVSMSSGFWCISSPSAAPCIGMGVELGLSASAGARLAEKGRYFGTFGVSRGLGGELPECPKYTCNSLSVQNHRSKYTSSRFDTFVCGGSGWV